jgi:hypothetical protein
MLTIHWQDLVDVEVPDGLSKRLEGSLALECPGEAIRGQLQLQTGDHIQRSVGLAKWPIPIKAPSRQH